MFSGAWFNINFLLVSDVFLNHLLVPGTVEDHVLPIKHTYILALPNLLVPACSEVTQQISVAPSFLSLSREQSSLPGTPTQDVDLGRPL